MPTPDFILRLREKIGNDELWLSGVTAVVLRGEAPEAGAADEREVLLVRRADNGEWTPVTGIIDPGEPPAVAAEREVLEEAGVVAVAEHLVRVHVEDRVVVYGNGDRSRYLDITFRCAWVSGEPYPADGENTEAAWYPVGALPPMSARQRERVEVALAGETAARFQR
ncbi:MAG: NUDIX domain-containing protein [Microbacteriaceae bacterium]|nr:NUDIX domain-containing protein [Microbacteriaceae bacterium]MCL2794488.1 NUDIX domain-containing protein [Microbacteriaceae bacterium]